MFFETRGSGTPVLAIHGWTPDHRLMLGCLEPLFSRLPDPYRRLYPDLPGMGRTPAGEDIASSDDILAALDAFVTEHIGTEPFLVVGESYGGYMARALARLRRPQVRGLALICPIGVAVEHAERTVPPHAILHAEPGAETGADPDFLEMAVVRTHETRRRYEAEIQPGVQAADLDAMARIRKRWTLSTPPESGPAFDRPTLILAGRQDQVTGYQDQYELLPHYPRATYAVLDMAGHNLQIEQPALFDALMTDWLARTAQP
ncbi:alpha/beta fold hydrolase [Dactylosporangium sp. CA-139066]|uniref:alpha/beta fold hydrolase n=1 Tax=Dactylosporangium sp. CA-139066 TaxID=3239930 RepID=UPI003D8A7A9E